MIVNDVMYTAEVKLNPEKELVENRRTFISIKFIFKEIYYQDIN